LFVPAIGFASDPNRDRSAFPATYVGGSLPLNQDKVKAELREDAVVLVQDKRRISVPIKDITQISCGRETHRRFGAVVLERVPLMRLGETADHHVGVSWIDRARAATVEVVFRLSKDDYHEFVAALERRTGRKAVDTTRVPTVVRYDL
jgi:hypothetical protein